MNEPVVAARTPIRVKLEAGKPYYYCTCGRSSDQPFCDGSHEGTAFTPQPFQVEKDRPALLCRCKRTATPPYCDGSHTALPAEAGEAEPG